MANLQEQNIWVEGIYQLEESDDVQGGADGIDNLQAKQLGSRTRYLKGQLEQLIALNPSEQASIYAAIMYATQLAQLANTGVHSLRNIAQQEGMLTITNRGVVRGCSISKSVTAARNISIVEGICFAAGRRFAVPETINAASVPSNPGAGAVTVFAYLIKQPGDFYRVGVTAIGEAVPAAGIKIYNITIPAGSTDITDPNLAGVTLTDARRIEGGFPDYFDSPATASAAITLLSSSQYGIEIDVVSAVGAPCPADAIVKASRATNGFTLQVASAADDIVLRWGVSQLNN